MSDMFDVYWRERGIALERSSRRNAARAQQIIDELAEERNAALRQRDAARERADVWQAHYIGLNARAEFLLQELDKAYGGAHLNPVRSPASEGEITLPRGPREGEVIDFSELVYLTAMNRHIHEKKSHLGPYQKLIERWKIFGAGTWENQWKERVSHIVEFYENYVPRLTAFAQSASPHVENDKIEEAEQDHDCGHLDNTKQPSQDK